MRSRRASFFSDQPVDLMVGAAAVFVLLLLLYGLLSPNFDTEEETAKSYLSTFNKQLQIADRGQTGEFRFLDLGSDSRNFFLVYFGDVFVRRASVEKDVVVGAAVLDDTEVFEFALKQKLEHAFCICYVEGRVSFCNACSSSRLPFKKQGALGIGAADTIVVSQAFSGETLTISKEEDFYVLSERQDE